MNTNKILSTFNLSKYYKRKKVVDDVSIELNSGEVVGLLGPNGAGKTTTFYMITGEIIPSSGIIKFNDLDISRQPMYKRARMGVGYLPQEASIFSKLTVEQNIQLVLEMTSLSSDEQSERVETTISDLSINHIRTNMAYTLSGGERRRVEIARCLAMNPSFMLLDEPFAGIDPIAVEEIQDIICNLKDKGIGILITDHNVRETLSITDRSYLLYKGKILMSGTAEDLSHDEEARKIYLGSKFKMH